MKSFKYYKEKKPLLTINLKIFTFFIAFLIFTGVHAREYQATYSFDIKNESITKVIEKIQKETGYIFFYYNGVIDPDLKINLKTNNLSLSQTLDRLFASTNNGYRLSGRQIFVFRKNEEKGNSIAPQQQTRKVTVKGTVTDDSGLSVIGASIVEKGTTNGTVTNIDGQFTLGNVAPGATVTISYIGFTTQTIIAKENETYNIRLKEDPKTMDEIVVIGYGTQRRSLVTSAISKLTIDESTTRQVASPSQLLNGRIAGVTTFTGSGNVGSGERMSVRGMASISAGNEPLYVIDGVPITNDSGNLFNFGETMSSLATLNTSDIESIEVLKDAASAAIYGSRATNGGVIVITTKSGKEGRSDVQVNVSTGFSKFPNIGKIKLADSELYIKDYNAGIDNYNKQYGYSVGSSGYKTHISNPFGDLPDTDWMDLITQTGTMFNMDASFSGGTKKTKYYIGANYNTTEGIIVNNKMNKVNLKAKVSHEFTPWLEVGTNNSANYTKNFQVPGAELGSTVIGRAIEQRPFDRPYKPTETIMLGGAQTNSHAITLCR